MRTGRPTKLTADRRDIIVDAIQRGCYVETAAEIAGIDKVTFYDWLKKGAQLSDELEKGVKITAVKKLNLIDFSNAVKRAIAQSELRDVAAIDSAAQNGVWQAAAWKLERKHHDRWGKKVAITDEKGGNFFTGMATAWAQALEADDDVIEGELDNTPIARINGNGSE